MPRTSPEVYRRRRIVALVILLVVIALVAWLVAAVVHWTKGGDDAAAPVPAPSVSSAAPGSKGTASASASSSPKPSPTGSAAEVPLCSDDAVTVEVTPDKESYKPKENPVFTMKITNASTVECAVNVGTEVMEFKVTLGNQQVFSTKDCQVGGETLYKLIQPGKSETARFTWNRNATAATCAATTLKIAPGNYQVTGTLGGSFSAPAPFELAYQ